MNSTIVIAVVVVVFILAVWGVFAEVRKSDRYNSREKEQDEKE